MNNDVFGQRESNPSFPFSLHSARPCAGSAGPAQQVERDIPPPPPTTVEDFFADALANGENFDRYHRAQVKCTPEGTDDQLPPSSFRHSLLQVEFGRSNGTNKRICPRKFDGIFTGRNTNDRLRFNATRSRVFSTRMMSWFVVKQVLKKRCVQLSSLSLLIRSFRRHFFYPSSRISWNFTPKNWLNHQLLHLHHHHCV